MNLLMFPRLDPPLIPTLLLSLMMTLSCDSADDVAFFEKKIRPVLIEHCYECHSASSKTIRGGLLVDSADAFRQGGDSGAAVVPGAPDDGTLMDALRHETFEMPPKQKLPEHVIADFETWIKRGAPDPRNTSTLNAKDTHHRHLKDGKNYWSFQPVQSPKVPECLTRDWADSSIDRFILSKLEDTGFNPVEDAADLVLLRRLYFDLTGLPPTFEQIETFLANDSATRIEEAVDALLNSPEFGRHWGRHWLDLARYSDSTGGGRSMLYGTSWRYRNYVIKAFSEDKPFDVFVKEQIAGDLMNSGGRPTASGSNYSDRVPGTWTTQLREPGQRATPHGCRRRTDRHDWTCVSWSNHWLCTLP